MKLSSEIHSTCAAKENINLYFHKHFLNNLELHRGQQNTGCDGEKSVGSEENTIPETPFYKT